MQRKCVHDGRLVDKQAIKIEWMHQIQGNSMKGYQHVGTKIRIDQSTSMKGLKEVLNSVQMTKVRHVLISIPKSCCGNPNLLNEKNANWAGRARIH